MIIIMSKHKEQNADKEIRNMISFAKIKAPENMKYRIMHQIEYEEALSTEKELKSSGFESINIFRELLSIFGIMYAIIAVISIASYYLMGPEFYTSIEFWGAIILVSLISSLLWLILRLDTFLQEKNFRKKTNQ